MTEKKLRAIISWTILAKKINLNFRRYQISDTISWQCFVINCNMYMWIDWYCWYAWKIQPQICLNVEVISLWILCLLLVVFVYIDNLYWWNARFQPRAVSYEILLLLLFIIYFQRWPIVGWAYFSCFVWYHGFKINANEIRFRSADPYSGTGRSTGKTVLLLDRLNSKIFKWTKILWKWKEMRCAHFWIFHKCF